MDNNWKSKTLEKISVKKGLVRGPFGGTLKKAYFKPQGYKVYEQKNAINKSISLGNYFVDRTKYQELERFHVKENDFIVSCSGTIGKIYQIPKGAPEGLINQALLKITLDNTIINNQFFYQYFQWQNFQRKIIDSTQGGAMPNLVGMKIFKKTKVNVPPIEEQEKIANILSTWDKAIELKQQLIDLKKEQKKGLMQKLLTGKVRSYKFDSQWKSQKLSRYLRESKIKSSSQDTSNRLTVKLHLKGVTQREVKPIEKQGATTQYIRKAGQLIYGKQNLHNGALGLVPDELNGYESSSDIPSFDINDNLNSYFLYYYLSRCSYYKSLEKIATGTGSKRIKPDDFLAISIRVPEYEEQKYIADLLLTFDKNIEVYQKELKALKEQKKGLMQQLLTGKTRVKV